MHNKKGKKKDSEEDEEILKVILLGESGVGKTNLINIATGKDFDETEATTSASSFSIRKVTIKKKVYALNIWDTIGQEKFRQFTKIFYNSSKIVIFVYDITTPESFSELNYWVEDIKKALGDKIIKGVVGNKTDLFLQEKVKESEGRDFAKSINAKFLSISAKEDSPEKFINFLEELLKDYLISNFIDREKSISLNKEQASDKYKKICC